MNYIEKAVAEQLKRIWPEDPRNCHRSTETIYIHMIDKWSCQSLIQIESRKHNKRKRRRGPRSEMKLEKKKVRDDLHLKVT